MQHTLVAVFDNRSDAQNAMNDLAAAGFARDAMRLSEDASATQGAASASAASGAGEGSIASNIKHFFSDLFGGGSTHMHKYSEAVARGHFVLTLTTADEPAVERAAGIVERHGPTDIDEQATQWTGAPPVSSADAGAHQQAPAQSRQQGGQGVQQRAPGAQPGAQGPLQGVPGSQQRADTGAQGRAIPQVQEEVRQREFQRGGVRVYSTEVIVEELSGDEESDNRSHWDRNYAGGAASYGDYAPAYRYGSAMARSDPYKGRKWEEAEASLKSDWEARHPGSAWEKFKAAIRHGWEKVTS